ncbi:unknown [Clostridium sp. CAG:590]|nr:unknown [Clostridium sp. CAG:590]
MKKIIKKATAFLMAGVMVVGMAPVATSAAKKKATVKAVTFNNLGTKT